MAITRDIAERQIVPPNTLIWLERQMPNTTLLIEENDRSLKTLVLTEKRLEERLNRHDRRGAVASYKEAIELRICAWPKPGEPQAILEKRNTAAMAMLDLAFRLYSR